MNGNLWNTLLTPLRKSESNISNTEYFIRRLREKTIPAGYKIISFDVKSLFNNVPLDKTIDFISKNVHDEKIIQTNISQNSLKWITIFSLQTVTFNFH